MTTPTDSKSIDAIFKEFNETFEKEIQDQEFAIDEAEWMSLIKALKESQQLAKQQIESYVTQKLIEELRAIPPVPFFLYSVRNDAEKRADAMQRAGEASHYILARIDALERLTQPLDTKQA